MAARRRRRRGGEGRFSADVNPDLTPLINCMFLLLVFFMVATTFVNAKGVSVDLPGGASEESRATKDVNVVIDEDGVLQLNGDVVTFEDLADRVKDIIESDNVKNAIVESSREIPHRDVIAVVDIVRGEGIESIAFAKTEE